MCFTAASVKEFLPAHREVFFNILQGKKEHDCSLTRANEITEKVISRYSLNVIHVHCKIISTIYTAVTKYLLPNRSFLFLFFVTRFTYHTNFRIRKI